MDSLEGLIGVGESSRVYVMRSPLWLLKWGGWPAGEQLKRGYSYLADGGRGLQQGWSALGSPDCARGCVTGYCKGRGAARGRDGSSEMPTNPARSKAQARWVSGESAEWGVQGSTQPVTSYMKHSRNRNLGAGSDRKL